MSDGQREAQEAATTAASDGWKEHKVTQGAIESACVGDYDSSYYVRCPQCGKLWNAMDDEPDITKDSEHMAECGRCETEFLVGVSVSIVFTSPARED